MIDIVKNISDIEKLKCGMLRSLSDVFTGMSDGSADNKALLAAIICDAYVLAAKTGIGADEIDTVIVNRLRAELLSGDSSPPYISRLLERFNN